MNQQKVLIVDDESAARRKLRGMLKEYSHLHIIEEAIDGEEAVKKIQELRPDLVFLDIQMPKKNGLEVALLTFHLDYNLIFVTAYDDYAIEAFETHALDYLLKPVTKKRLKASLDKLERFSSSQNSKQLKGLLKRLYPADLQQQIAIRHGNATLIFEVEDIAYIEAEEGFCNVFLTVRGQDLHELSELLADSSLDNLLQLLPAEKFMRIHRSFIINTKEVKSYHSDGRNIYLCMKGFPDKKLPVSRVNAPLVKNLWKPI
jgi:DNA-binding LytR/AlgR family response regulator